MDGRYNAQLSFYVYQLVAKMKKILALFFITFVTLSNGAKASSDLTLEVYTNPNNFAVLYSSISSEGGGGSAPAIYAYDLGGNFIDGFHPNDGQATPWNFFDETGTGLPDTYYVVLFTDGNFTISDFENDILNPKFVTYEVVSGNSVSFTGNIEAQILANVSNQLGDTGTLALLGVIIGIPLAFYVFHKLIGLIPKDRDRVSERAERAMRKTDKLLNS